MKKHLLFRLSLIVALFMFFTSAYADDDVTSTYLTNANFNTSCLYPTDSTATNLGTSNVATNAQNATGWTANIVNGYYAASSFEYGYAGTLNNVKIPETGPSAETGAGEGTLGMITSWSGALSYYQTVTLPAGAYKLIYSINNTNTSATASTKSISGFVADSNTAYLSTKVGFDNAWKNDTVSFTLTASTSGKIQVGIEAADAGSGANCNAFFDDVKLIKVSSPSLTVSETALSFGRFVPKKTFIVTGANLTEAVTLTAPTGITLDKTSLTQAEAQTGATVTATFDNTTNVSADITITSSGVTKTIAATATQSDSNDATSAIINPSFEYDNVNETTNITGWTNPNGFKTQNNTSFFYKKGTYYCEKWQSISDGGWKNIKLYQTLRNLPNGYYKLSAGALNALDKDTEIGGAYIFANTDSVEVIGTKDYSVVVNITNDTLCLGYAVIDGGNYVAVDNFRLTYLGESYVNITSSTSSIALDAYTTTGTFNISGLSTENATLTAPTGISLDYATLTSAELAAGKTITATFDNSTEVSGKIYVVSGTAKDSISINGAKDTYTSAIINPSFETGNMTGWTNQNGFETHVSTGIDPYRDGTYFAERWQSGGNSWSNIGISQVVKGIPSGKYTLTAAAQSIQQGDNTYPGGAYIFANEDSTEVYEINNYSVTTVVPDDSITIGFAIVNSGNWLAVDNFRLIRVGDLTGVNTASINQSLKVFSTESGLSATFNVESSSVIEFNIYNTNGMLMYSANDNYNAGAYRKDMNVQLQRGVYMVRMTENGQSTTIKVIK